MSHDYIITIIGVIIISALVTSCGGIGAAILSLG